MVLPLKPVKFYGSSLPRPRIYTDVKLSDERVDPPVPVLDPLMSWAADAHWSMGGLSFNRLRLQGKIEGNVKKLKKEIEKKIHNSPSPLKRSKKSSGDRVEFDSPPPAPISKKRRQRVKMVDEDDVEEDEEDWVDDEFEIESRNEVKRKRRRLVRKLGDDFELVGNANRRSPLKDLSNGGGIDGVALRTRSRRSMVVKDGGEDGGKKSEGKKGGVENGKVDKIKKKSVYVSPSKGSGSSKGSRGSPRLKKRLDCV